jgi:3-oxoacyl-[acyl-carrier protein] reductase
MLTGRDEARLREAAASFGGTDGDTILTFAGDLTEADVANACVRAARSRWGRLDILVANVGSGRGSAGLDASDSEWDEMLRMNLLGSVRLTRAAVPLLTAGGGGTIVFVASIAGLEALRAPLAYGAAKAGLVHAAKGLAAHLAPSGIRVNVVAPGNVIFPGGRWEQIQAAEPEDTARYIEKHVPLGRFGRPEEIASAVVFLASERASFITGACLVVDGGQTRSV